ncbi:outer membrane beta-barrel protein [Pseudochryseolinea flava]|uniref:Outer membrane protein beta-barrel domain-containing protein n=1 Tax=Pseudochryseolinea flava TaxID=2059302 RepID=A0A364XX74_9BACT|nr:outer membrane beta-barrel protein [Pseudochryseolinea flava]RAV98803.1 hypothetical protein DQQ10_22570 [Pseudochryseolinea flava]
MMLRGIVSLVLFCSTVSVISAQVRVEAVIGPNHSFTWGADGSDDGPSSKFGFTVGGGVSFNLRRDGRFLYGQLVYEQKGDVLKSGQYRYIDGGDPMVDAGTAKIIRRFNYLTIPINYGFEGGTRVRWTFSFGPYVSVLLNAVSFSRDDRGSKSNLDLQSLDAGLSFNAGMYIPLKQNVDVKIGLQQNVGLTNVYEDVNLKNHSLNLQVGLCYKISDKIL